MTTTSATSTGAASTSSASAAKKTASVLPRRLLRPLLFLGLSHADRSYGYELAETVRGFGLSIDMAGVYRELRSMEQRDLLTSDWEPSDNGPDRRVYMVTPSGREALAQAVADLRLARDQLTAALASVDLENVDLESVDLATAIAAENAG